MRDIIVEYLLENRFKDYEIIENELFSIIEKQEEKISNILVTGCLENLLIYWMSGDKIKVFCESGNSKHILLINKENKNNLRQVENELFELTKFDSELIENIFNQTQVMLINLSVIENFPIPRLNLSTGVIASYVRKRQKARVKILDMQARISIEEICEEIKKLKPRLVGISISFGQQCLADELLRYLKEYVNDIYEQTQFVLGNVLPALYPEEYLKDYPNFIISYQEGEQAFIDLVDFVEDKISLRDIQGICFQNGNNIIKTDPYTMRMCDVPFPAVDSLEGILAYKGVLTFETSRSCNYAKCTFCPRVHKGTQWRGYTSGEIVEKLEIISLIFEVYNLPQFLFVADEEFIGQLPHSEELKRINSLCEMIKIKGIDIKFDTSARIDSIYDPKDSDVINMQRLQMWKNLKDAGLNRLFIGIESGSNSQLKRFGKGTTAVQNKIGLQLITALGINVRFGYITFDPLMNDIEELEESHRFVEQNDILLDPTLTDRFSIETIFRSVVQNNREFINRYSQEIPLYERISYPLTSLEVLFGSRYSKMMQYKQAKTGEKLIIDLDKNMGRYKVNYTDEWFGSLSDASQKWIDCNFPIMYTLKGLFKSAEGTTRSELFSLMSEAKSIDHFLLNFLILERISQNENPNWQTFIDKYNLQKRDIEKMKYKEINEKLNFWKLNVMHSLIERISFSLENGTIIDTPDSKLSRSVIKWKDNKGIWKNIN